MFVQVEQTPNPATLKFIPGVTVMSHGTKFYQDESTGDTNVTVDLEKAVLRGDSKEVSDNEILVKTSW